MSLSGARKSGKINPISRPLSWRSLQAAKTAAEATETAAKEAEKCADEGDALEATAKAAIAAWRASQVGITSLAWTAA